jgi:hypothetical protein
METRNSRFQDKVVIVTHLCSDEANFLNGGAYTVDGGVTA